MEPVPPTLDDMGHVLWGPHWRDALAEALNRTKSEVSAWEADPDSRPAELERMIEDIGLLRLEEIGSMLVQMKETGLARTQKA